MWRLPTKEEIKKHIKITNLEILKTEDHHMLFQVLSSEA